MMKNPFHIGIILDDLITERVTRNEALDKIWNLIYEERCEIAGDLSKICETLANE